MHSDIPIRSLAELEERAIRRALTQLPNRVECARALGIGRSTLYRKMDLYKIGDSK